MRRLWSGIAALLLSIFINQIANLLDLSWGIGAAIASAIIGYGLLVTSAPVRRHIWEGIGGKRPVMTVVLAGLLTGLAGAGVAWFLVRQPEQRALDAEIMVLLPARNYEFRWVPLDNLQPVLRPEPRPDDAQPPRTLNPVLGIKNLSSAPVRNIRMVWTFDGDSTANIFSSFKSHLSRFRPILGPNTLQFTFDEQKGIAREFTNQSLV